MERTILVERALPADSRFAQLLDSLVCLGVIASVIGGLMHWYLAGLLVILSVILFVASLRIRESAIEKTKDRISEIVVSQYLVSRRALKMMAGAHVPSEVRDALEAIQEDADGPMPGAVFVTRLEDSIARNVLRRHIGTILTCTRTTSAS